MFYNIRHTVLFLTFSLFFLSTAVSYSNVFTKKSSNPRIHEAQKLMREKKYNDALLMLKEELLTDDKNEDLIMKLIDSIDKEKEKVIGMIYTAKEKIKEGDFVTAREIIDELGNSGDFDSRVNNLIAAMSKDKELLAEITTFNNKVIEEGEKYLIGFKIAPAMDSYKSALDIFRNYKTEDGDAEFARAIRLFNAAEKKLLESDAANDMFQGMTLSDYNIMVQEKNKMDNITKDWKNIEKDFGLVKNILDKVNPETKKSIVYEAYNSITNKYTNLLRRGVQKYGVELLNNLFGMAKNEINSLENNINYTPDNINRLISLFPDIEKESFYNININFLDSSQTAISKTNLLSYLDYLTKKNALIINSREVIAKNDYLIANNYYDEFTKQKDSKELFEAEKTIKNADNKMSELFEKNNNINNMMNLYQGFNYGEFSELINKKKELDQQSKALNEKIKKSMNELDKSLAYIKSLLNEADKHFDDSVKSYNAKLFSKAKEAFGTTKDKYYEIVLLLKSDYVNEQIDKIDDYLDRIEQVIFSSDMKLADEYLEKAKAEFYAEKYEDAKNNIDEADKIFIKYNQNKDIIDFYRERILHAIKIQSGKILSIDDQAYEEITELFRNARFNYNQKKYDEALKYLNQVLLEKPYYEEAKLFEIKLLRETDPASFENIFKDYYNKALAKYNGRLYEDALVEFQQLLQFEKNINEIRNYIYQCKVRLNLTKPTLTENDKNQARSIIDAAKASYAEGDFQGAYNKVNEALKIWDDVPEAKSIKLACMQKLRIERPKLSKDNELLYREALQAYSENDFEKAYQLTLTILRTQDFEEVRRLNKKAEIKRGS